MSRLVPFRVYGANNSNGKTCKKIAMIILVKGEVMDGRGVGTSRPQASKS
jgi:hypothetical protein